VQEVEPIMPGYGQARRDDSLPKHERSESSTLPEPIPNILVDKALAPAGKKYVLNKNRK